MKIRQLIDATIKAERGLTLVTSTAAACIAIEEGMLRMYPHAKYIPRYQWEIEGVAIRVQFGLVIPTVYNVWHV